MLEYLPPLNEHNLPYPDTMHPIVVHFVIAMVLFAVVCDVIGYFTRNARLYEVSWWNLFFATISIFIAIVFAAALFVYKPKTLYVTGPFLAVGAVLAILLGWMRDRGR